jgi:ABC-type polysaccharide/polyol phosphate transport system ATPase subunit
MTDTAIHVEGLSKRYRVGERERYLALRDVLARAIAKPFSGARQRRAKDYLWALRDVSLDVRQGEVVGLIGRNGAGKTTLLKILSRITRPTEGFAEIHGRVGSLLEVGTGFHPELTGRENVYLSGAILGMKRAEIGRKFDEIAAFAGVERFLDTPLKHFSTGMQMRLAFAVAAHLEPEILLVDEVLAVGDLEFQKKCLGKMSEVSKGGRTIVFVSHQMSQIRRLCERVIWIDSGAIRADARTAEVVNSYEMAAASGDAFRSNGRAPDAIRWEIIAPGNDGASGNILETFGDVEFRFSWSVRGDVQKGAIGIVLRNSEGQVVWATVQSSLNLRPGEHSCSIAVPFFPVLPGAYSWNFGLYDGHRWIDYGQCSPELRVETRGFMHPFDQYKGFLNIPYEFKLQTPQ